MRPSLLPLLLIAACDAPHASRLSRALALRAGQSFHAVPPESAVRAPVRARPTRDAAIGERAAGESSVAAAPVATVVPLGPPQVLVAFADSVVLAPGDSSPLSVSALDGSGRVVPLASVRWRSLSPRVAEVGPWGVRGGRAGQATLVAEGDGLATRVDVIVRAMVRGRVLDVDGAPVAGARVRVETGALRRDLVTDASGRFALDDAIAADAGVRVDVEPAATAALHAATARVFADDADRLNVVLLPTDWRVRGGRYDGTMVPLQPSAAVPRGGGFARMHDSPSEPGARVVGWPTSRLPIRLATAADLSSLDTAAFWATARAVERDLGMRLFVPAGADDGGPRAVEVRVGPTGGADAVTHASWAAGGDVDDAEIVLSASSVLRERGVVAHELLHLLGFGHNSAWPSVVSPGGSRAPGWLTAEDVAWTQLLYRLRDTQARERAPFGLGAAIAGTGTRD